MRVDADRVLQRDGHACVVCGASVGGERGWDWSVHHRRPRGMGGSRRADTDSPVNLLTVCGSGTTGDHGYIERNRVDAFAHGWLVPQSKSPAEIPVYTFDGRWVYLTSDYGYSDDPPLEAA